MVRLAKALHAVRRLCPTVPVLAIQWLHLRHPIYVEQEALLRGDGAIGRAHQPLAGIGGAWWEMARCLGHAVGRSVVLLGFRWRLREAMRALRRQRFDVVAKTWCYEPHGATPDRDFYYGHLQESLAAQGVRMLLLCGYFDKRDWRAFAEAHASVASSNRLPELCLVPPLAPLATAFGQVGAAVRLRRIAGRARNPLLRRVSSLASRACLSPATTDSAMFYWVGRAAGRTWRPRAFLTLYEGNSWEKCAWWGMKEVHPSCRVVGYQHTAVYPESQSLRQPFVDIRARSVPDLVLALGDRTLELMRRGHEPHQARLLSFGSFRGRPLQVAGPADPSTRHILVVPEGTPFEMTALFSFTSDCARRLPSCTFILRTHPQWPMARALTLAPPNLRDRPNIQISDRPSIADDFRRCSFVLYRGSSAVLYAVLHGLKPLYLSHESWFDVDPLFELTTWRESVSSPSELEETLARYPTLTAGYVEEWRRAVEYVNTYTVPVQEAAIEQLLVELDLPGSRRGGEGVGGAFRGETGQAARFDNDHRVTSRNPGEAL